MQLTCIAYSDPQLCKDVFTIQSRNRNLLLSLQFTPFISLYEWSQSSTVTRKKQFTSTEEIVYTLILISELEGSCRKHLSFPFKLF